MVYKKAAKELEKLSSPDDKKILKKFFKTEKGQYGYGDKFLGIRVPEIRKVAKKFEELSLFDLEQLLKSSYHEQRMLALIILISQFKRSKNKKKYFDFYIKHIRHVNSWDLVDISAPKIVGEFLLDTDHTILLRWAKSTNLWQKRVAMVSCLTFVRNKKKTHLVLGLADLLLDDSHDLIHKAVGWVLRELSKQNKQKVLAFIDKYYFRLSRTTLRYTIEQFPDKQRKSILLRKNKKTQIV
ncbi:MAG: DNA alkylation repair protein [Zetaproteobacteria bacterium]|nr:DNA alkylation repair protein [Pseudobdellovibrionaceae bacterium]|tara:strand:- start:415 stop:1134 length:720 start_codon:yes stop_codon:yes gene_type:complete